MDCRQTAYSVPLTRRLGVSGVWASSTTPASRLEQALGDFGSVSAAGAVVIDTGPSRRYGEAIARPLPAWTETIALARYEYERSVMHLYPKLEAEQWPRVDKDG